MANLAEADTWSAGIYQIETTDPVVGGAPNEGTGAGMSNIPHQQLAKRTTWLKARIDDLLGNSGAFVAGLLTRTVAGTTVARTLAAGTGILVTNGNGVAGNPTITADIATQVIAEAGTNNTQIMTPFRTAQLLNAKTVSNFSANGYQKLPSGLIIQWGTFTLDASAASEHAVTLPIAYPTAHISAYTGVNNAADQMVGIAARTLTSVTIRKGVSDLLARSGFWFSLGY